MAGEVEEACARLVIRIWDDDDYATSAVANPRGALAENGWTPPEGVEVHIELVEPEAFSSEGTPTPEDASARLRESIERGSITLTVPSSRPESAKLSDEQLGAVSGGSYLEKVPPGMWAQYQSH
jgi:hypothetical protein